MTSVVQWLHVPGMLMKDAGARCIMSANKMVNRREMPPVLRIQNIRVYRGVIPIYTDAAFIAPSAQIWGNVVLGHNSSIMYHTYIRNFHLGKATTIGDNTTIADRTTFMGQIRVGNDCFVGVGCTLDCCEIMNNVYISHGCAIQYGAVIEDGAVLALGTVLPKDARVKANEYWAGHPGKFVCKVDGLIRERTAQITQEYVQLGKGHKKAVDDHMKDGEVLDEAWLKATVAKMEARRQDVAVPVKREIPSIAKRFLTPRVTARLPQFHARVSYPCNRQAPWMTQGPDNGGNA